MKGQVLLEVLIALALVAIAIPPLFAALSSSITSADHLRDHSIRLEISQSQLEFIQGQKYLPKGESYHLITVPPKYTLKVESSDQETYNYPDGTQAPGKLRKFAVSVKGRYGTSRLEGLYLK